jgi:hypothetical protein
MFAEAVPRAAGAFPGHGEPADRGGGGLWQSGTDPVGEGAWRFAGPGTEPEVGEASDYQGYRSIELLKGLFAGLVHPTTTSFFRNNCGP